MAIRVKIRGIYSTAFTKLLLDSGYAIAEPSPEIRERFGLSHASRIPDISIQDRLDHHGVEVVGETERICGLLRLLQGSLLDAVLMRFEPLDEPEGMARAELELPGASKEALDKIRSAVVPTLSRHHRLRLVDPQSLEGAERELTEHPQRRAALDADVFQKGILVPLQKVGQVRLDQLRASGRPIRPREGLLVESNAHRIIVKRLFSQGRYDGLDLPIEKGDYGLTEAQEGAWFVKHAYYAKDGRLKGEYFNINTPVEFYPYGARYLDLEVDVVRRAGERPFMVDQEKLAVLTKEGFIGPALADRTMRVAESLMESLSE